MRRLAVITAVLALAGAASARAEEYPDCVTDADAAHAAVVHPERSAHTAVTIPGASGLSYAGDVFAPDPMPAGKRFPVAIVMHGGGATPCDVWWVSRLLAGRRWIVVDVYRPSGYGGNDAVTAQTDAVVATAAYARDPSFQYAAVAQTDRLALIGHSLGASAVAAAQSAVSGVGTIVALDNLKRWGARDPGSGENCTGTPKHENVPTVPALAFASDHHCQGQSTLGLPHREIRRLKETGWNWWRSQKPDLASVVLVMQGFVHTSFAGTITDDQITRLKRVMIPWLRHYVRLDPHPAFPGVPAAWLSTHYLSGAYVPAQGIDCEHVGQC